MSYPDPLLRIKAKSLDPADIPGNIALIKDLAYTMYKEDGIGLAATQVGINKRIILIDISRKLDKDKEISYDKDIIKANKGLIVAINPEIVSAEGKIDFEEGCLSIPGFNAKVSRSRIVKVKTLDLSGKEIFFDAEDLLAVVFQHEIDHLNGTLFIDKVSPLKRSLYNASIKKSRARKTEKNLSLSNVR